MKRWMIVIGLMLVGVVAAQALDRKSFIIFTGAATDTTAVGMADSSSVFFTGNLHSLYLDLTPNRPCRVAIQVRAHGDTISSTGAIALTDSTKSFAWPWRAYTGAAGTLVNQADSSVWIETTMPTSVVAGEDEMVVEFGTGTTARFWGPRGKHIALRKVDNGESYWGQHTSIRVRVLQAGGVVTWTKGVLTGTE